MREAQVTRGRQDPEELRVQGRLAAGELDRAGRHRLLLAQRPQQADHVLEGGLGQVAGLVGAGEADRTGQVAAVAEVDLAQAAVAHVLRARAAVGGTGHGGAGLNRLNAALVLEAALLAQQVEPRVGGDLVAEVAVLGAGLLHPDRAVALVAAAEDQAGALRAERLDRARQRAGERADRGAREGRARLTRVGLRAWAAEEDVRLRLAPRAAARAVELQQDQVAGRLVQQAPGRQLAAADALPLAGPGQPGQALLDRAVAAQRGLVAVEIGGRGAGGRPARLRLGPFPRDRPSVRRPGDRARVFHRQPLCYWRFIGAGGVPRPCW